MTPTFTFMMLTIITHFLENALNITHLLFPLIGALITNISEVFVEHMNFFSLQSLTVNKIQVEHLTQKLLNGQLTQQSMVG